MRIKLRRPRHATLVAYLALFVALGGSSYAALRVTGKNVPKDALTGADIKKLTAKDFKGGDVPTDATIVVSQPPNITANAGQRMSGLAQCPPDTVATGGGYLGTDGVKGAVVMDVPAASPAIQAGQGWYVEVLADQALTFTVYAVCITS